MADYSPVTAGFIYSTSANHVNSSVNVAEQLQTQIDQEREERKRLEWRVVDLEARFALLKQQVDTYTQPPPSMSRSEVEAWLDA